MRGDGVSGEKTTAVDTEFIAAMYQNRGQGERRMFAVGEEWKRNKRRYNMYSERRMLRRRMQKFQQKGQCFKCAQMLVKVIDKAYWGRGNTVLQRQFLSSLLEEYEKVQGQRRILHEGRTL
jgi:hypothetical protein